MMLAAAGARISPPCLAVAYAEAKNGREKSQREKPSSGHGFGAKRKDAVWQCVPDCGACCKLEKGSTFPSPEEILHDPSDVQLYRSLIRDEDGWCIHYDKTSRKCSIYADRPYFCRVEPQVFETLYGIDKKRFNKEACRCCIDTIKSVYGTNSEELGNFNHAIYGTQGMKLEDKS